MSENGEKRKVKQAIALEYNPAEDAPKVVASGRGLLAEKIIERAKESDVPIHRDDKLADTLSRLEIGDMIPIRERWGLYGSRRRRSIWKPGG